MEGGGNRDADSLDFVEKVSVMLKRLGSASLSDFPGTRGVGGHHADQFHAFHLGIFLRMELTKVTNADHPHLDFFHLAADPPLRMSDKLEEMLDPWELKNVIFLNGLHRLLQGEPGSEDDPVGLLQSLDFLLRKLVAFQTDVVEPVKLRPVSSGHRLGRKVLDHAGYPTDHRMSTNPAELMDRNQSANNRMIFDENVSSQGCHIGHDHIIPNLTVVGDMGVGHDKSLISKNGFSAPFDRSSMEGDVLPNDIMIPHLQEGGLSPVSKGLGRFSDGAKLIDLTFLSNLSPLPDDHMGSDPR